MEKLFIQILLFAISIIILILIFQYKYYFYKENMKIKEKVINNILKINRKIKFSRKELLKKEIPELLKIHNEFKK